MKYDNDDFYWAGLGPDDLHLPLRDGEPCSHPGCLRHLSHPCEGCGRIGGHYPVSGDAPAEQKEEGK
jgi:hypothetical protein